DVLQFRLPLKFAVGDLLADVIQSFHDGLVLLLREHADSFEHRRVGDRTQEILTPQPPVKRDGFGEPGCFKTGSAGEPSAARNRGRTPGALESRPSGRK